MIQTPLLTRCRWDPALEHADIGPTGKDFAFGSYEERSKRRLFDCGHGGAEVFDHLPAEQIERRIREREDAQRTRDFETDFVHT